MNTLRTLAVTLPVAALLAACGGGDAPADDAMMMDTTTITVAADLGLQTPESVLYDADRDIYLVSNINGAPTAEDGNGFISQVTPEGEIAALKWVDGQTDGVTLNAPKGMALLGDTLYVADITAVRAFHRVSGEPLGSWTVEGATFLNDLAASDDGTLYVSDSGLNPDFSSSGTDAVYRFEDGEPVVVSQGTDLAGPNGLAVRNDLLMIVTFGAPEIKTVPRAGGEPSTLTQMPGGSLDGVVRLDDGSLLVSSWETSTVYHVPAAVAEGQITPVVEGVPSPADIGWDSQRHRVLIPVFQENRLEFHYVETDHQM